jgi:DNA polymerase IV
MFVRDPAIIHVDMDAFFASVEQARRPELRGRPVLVGGRRERRGVVAAASYEARAFGVFSAMPLAQAERLCPQAVVLPADFAAYTAVHRDLREVFGRFTDLVEVVSIDEAFLDVTGSRRLCGPPLAIAHRIQELVYERHAITCSAGIGPNKLLAKLASDLNKPAGIGELTAADVGGRLRDLPVRDLWGIGPVAEQRLAALGLTTVGMVQDVPLPLLAAAFGRSAAALKQAAYGRSLSPVRSRTRVPKSMGHETTFATDVADHTVVRRTLLALTDELMTRLRGKGYAARTVAVKVRDSGFHTVDRHCTLSRPTTSTGAVYRTALRLFAGVELGGRPVRLVGVTVSDLQDGSLQLSFDDRWRESALDEVVDSVRSRFGSESLRRAVTHAKRESLC